MKRKRKQEYLDEMVKQDAEDTLNNLTKEELEELDRLLSKVDGNHKVISITRATTCIHCPCCGHEIRIQEE